MAKAILQRAARADTAQEINFEPDRSNMSGLYDVLSCMLLPTEKAREISPVNELKRIQFGIKKGLEQHMFAISSLGEILATPEDADVLQRNAYNLAFLVMHLANHVEQMHDIQERVDSLLREAEGARHG